MERRPGASEPDLRPPRSLGCARDEGEGTYTIMNKIFFTGFPGFLGSELLPRVLHRLGDSAAVCLVQPKFAELAAQRVKAIEARERSARAASSWSRATSPPPVSASATPRPCCATCARSSTSPRSTTSRCAREVGLKVNVDGTRHVLDFAAALPATRALPVRLDLLRLRAATPASFARPTSTRARSSTTTTRRPSTWPRSRCRRG